MTIPTTEQIPKSWIHEPERVAAEHAEKVQSFLRTAEIPGLHGGIALTFLGRRMRGVAGRGLSALGTTMALGAASRAVYRIGPTKIRTWIASKFPPVPAA